MHPSLPRLALVVLVSFLAGGINAIAGGGTLLTFPALIGLGIPPVIANATSTVALWPGSLGSIWGYRGELQGARRWAIGFAIPSLLGGAIGGVLLLRTPPVRFDALVPWLVLGATGLFIAQQPLVSLLRRRVAAAREAHLTDAELTDAYPGWLLLGAQVVISVYGGYFGAGMGILMLAAFGLMGLRNIHRMNGLKNWGGLCANATAALIFAMSALVDWPVALTMAVGGALGGYAGSRLAQATPAPFVRRAVVAIGLASGVWLYVAQHRGLL